MVLLPCILLSVSYILLTHLAFIHAAPLFIGVLSNTSFPFPLVLTLMFLLMWILTQGSQSYIPFRDASFTTAHCQQSAPESSLGWSILATSVPPKHSPIFHSSHLLFFFSDTNPSLTSPPLFSMICMEFVSPATTPLQILASTLVHYSPSLPEERLFCVKKMWSRFLPPHSSLFLLLSSLSAPPRRPRRFRSSYARSLSLLLAYSSALPFPKSPSSSLPP